MEVFIETRFGDPVLSIDISTNYIVYGSALGQIGIFQTNTKEQILITEIAEEGISGIYIADDNIVYATVGDLYMLILKRDNNNQWHTEGKPYEFRQHTQVICNNTQVLQHKTKVCLVMIENYSIDFLHDKLEVRNRLLTFDCNSGENEELQNFSLPRFSVPFDYTQEKLLWVEIDSQGLRVVKFLNFQSLSTKVIKYLNSSFGPISNLRIVQDTVIFIHNLNSIKVMEINSGSVISEIGKHNTEILDIFPFCAKSSGNFEEKGNLQYSDLVISVDKDAKVYLWQDGEVLEVIDMCALDGISVDDRSRYFGMGYPYILKAYGQSIVITTDIGIVVLRSDYLANLIN